MNAEKVNQRINSMRKFMESWAPFALAESECTITITPVDGGDSFKTNIYDRSFDLFIKPALQQAMTHTLEVDKAFLKGIVKNIESVLGQTPEVNKKKYTCPECGGDDVELSCMINPNTMERIGEPSDDDEGFCNDCGRHYILNYK